MRRRRVTLAGQYLGLQLLIILVVLVFVAAISMAQARADLERVEGRRALQAAENLAGNPTVRLRLPGAVPGIGLGLPAVAETVRTVSGSSSVLTARLDRTVVSSSDPALVGTRLELGASNVLEGRSWTGLVRDGDRTVATGHAPVYLPRSGEVVGFVVVGRDAPSTWGLLWQDSPDLLTYLGVASVLGVAGSLLLSRRVKRQTLGLEPAEITGLVEHREAMLHGLKEGVVALDPQHRVTLVNDSARQLLGLPVDCIGRALEDLDVDPQLCRVLTQGETTPRIDQLVLVGERVLALNRMPMRSRGRVIGAVATLRDRTELSSLEQQLGTTRATSDTLRAQTHEFANQLHTISGLLHLQEYEEVVRFVDGVSLSRTTLYDEVTSRVEDPTVAALLIAKASLAAERDVDLRLLPESTVGRVDEDLSRDLTTVVGNLVDNALDAVTGCARAVVAVGLFAEPGAVRVQVHDSGPGVPAGDLEKVFTQGYSTKAEPAQADAAGRGFGLALTRLVCRRRGGDVRVVNRDGAVFTALLPTGRPTS